MLVCLFAVVGVVAAGGAVVCECALGVSFVKWFVGSFVRQKNRWTNKRKQRNTKKAQRKAKLNESQQNNTQTQMKRSSSTTSTTTRTTRALTIETQNEETRSEGGEEAKTTTTPPRKKVHTTKQEGQEEEENERMKAKSERTSLSSSPSSSPPPPQQQCHDGDDEEAKNTETNKKGEEEEEEEAVAKLGIVFEDCGNTKAKDKVGNTVFKTKKFCSACCAGAKMMDAKILTPKRGGEREEGGERRKKIEEKERMKVKKWKDVLKSGRKAKEAGCCEDKSVFLMAKMNEKGEGFEAVEKSWFGLIEAAIGNKEFAEMMEEEDEEDGVWREWLMEMNVVRGIEGADDGFVMGKWLCVVLRDIEQEHSMFTQSATAAASSSSMTKNKEEEEGEARRRRKRKVWMRCIGACCVECMKASKRLWAPKCLDNIVESVLSRHSCVFGSEEAERMEAWRREVSECACGRSRALERCEGGSDGANAFERDVAVWEQLDVPHGKSRSAAFF